MDDNVPVPPPKPALIRSVTASSRKLPSLLEPQSIVIVNVSPKEHHGGGSEQFLIHKNFITYYSPYFEALFDGGFAEGETQESSLDDTDPATFGVFVSWLYTQQIQSNHEGCFSMLLLKELWILADRLLIPTLQNDALRKIESLLAKSSFSFTNPSIFFMSLYEDTAEGSSLRAYFVDVVTKCGKIEAVMAVFRYEGMPHEALVYLMEAAIMIRKERSAVQLTTRGLEKYLVAEDLESRKRSRVLEGDFADASGSKRLKTAS